MNNASSQRRSQTDVHGARALSGREIKQLLWNGVRIINPTFPRRLTPGYYVCNTHRPADGAGHWVAIRVNRCGWSGEFFDSYGEPPEAYGLQGFLSCSVRGCWKFNNINIQGPHSFTCGHHCVMYCVMSLGGVPMETFVQLFQGTGHAHNDKLALNFVRRLRDGKTKFPSRPTSRTLRRLIR